MADKKEVVISTSALNSYGFRVITSGINIEQYKKNPILLWGHHRTWKGTTDEVLPIGLIENLRIDGDKLIGTPVFDENDEFALKIKAKWDAGILQMVSAGLDVIEKSQDAAFLLPGQTRMSVTKSKLLEVSIVDIGANDEALVLYNEGKLIKLSNKEDCEVETINIKLKQKMNKIALKLGLQENATEDEILLKVGELQKNASKVSELETRIASQEKEAIEQEINNAISLKKINEGQKSHFVELANKAGIEMLRQTLFQMRASEKPSDVIAQSSVGGDSKIEKLSDLTDEGKVKLRKENAKEYARLYKAEYGMEPEFNK